MSRTFRRLIALTIPLVLALAWAGGEARTKDAAIARITNISGDIVELAPIDETLYRGHLNGRPEEVVYVALASRPSYGGPLSVAAVMDGNKKIRQVALLESSDTSTYLDKVVGLGVLRAFVGRSAERLPEVDGVSGATLSSTAITRGLEAAARRIGTERFGMPPVKEAREPVTPEKTKLLSIALLFAGSLFVTGKRFRWDRKKGRFALMVLSVLTLGVLFGGLFSLSTVVTLLSGDWLGGMASYAALLCLLLALLAYVALRKNLYCSTICPFGAVQEGLGCITRCSAPQRDRWMAWAARSFTFAVLAAALYFRMPSDAIYEPFGKAFNFIGSGTLYGLTILVLLSSLAVKRPWCLLFCPVASLFDYLRLVRSCFENQGATGRGQESRKERQSSPRKALSIALFLGFLLLCGTEIVPKVRDSAEKDNASVLYVESADRAQTTPAEEAAPVDYREFLEASEETIR